MQSGMERKGMVMGSNCTGREAARHLRRRKGRERARLRSGQSARQHTPCPGLAGALRFAGNRGPSMWCLAYD